jgi:hypothetical protein
LNLTQIATLQNVVGAAIENEPLEYDSVHTSLVNGENTGHVGGAVNMIRDNREIVDNVKPVRDGL